MRRKPQAYIDPRVPGMGTGTKRPPPTDDPQAIEAFLKSGGRTFYLIDTEIIVDFDPRPDAVQLITYVYVPFGRIGFLKELRVAPFIPPVFSDPWPGWVPNQGNPAWRTWAPLGAGSVRAAGTNGVWTTPMGWESYFNQGDPSPVWRWHLRLVPGDVGALRSNPATMIPPFSTSDPTSWYMVPDIPVPRSAYRTGLPGRAPGIEWGPQRVQVLQGDALHSHVIVPQNFSLCLFAEWTQLPVTPNAEYNSGEGQGDLPYSVVDEYPLLPSWGSLHGYMQTIGDGEAVNENGLFGWGG